MSVKLLEKLRAKPKHADGVDASLGQDGREAFSGWPMVLGWLAMLIFTFHACTHMVAAGDTWVAMACGRHFTHHGVDTVEPFSANSHRAGPTAEDIEAWPGWARGMAKTVGLETVKKWHPTGWVNQNWLTHLIFYWLTTTLGSETRPYFDALVLWKISIYVLAALCLYYTTRLYGVNRALAAVFVCFAMFIGRSFFDVRPAGFSNLLVAAYVLVLALASYRNHRYVWLMVPLVVFWANVHGGYVYAFIMLVPFVIWHLVMNLPRRWMLVAYSALMWLVLFAMANRFLHRAHLEPVAVSKDWAFYLFALSVVGSILLARHRQVGDEGLVVFLGATSCVLFLLFLTRFFPAVPLTLGGREKENLEIYITGSQLAYLGIFCFAMILGAVVAVLKETVVQVMPPRAIVHTAAAGAVAFVAMVVLNPFHLTNLTHTFEISVSKHAERWRNVHEWNPAFDWDNQVGTAYPFLFLFVLAWLALAMWVMVSAPIFRTPRQVAKKRAKTVVEYRWRRVDLGLWAIAAMTVYMAIRSRRFIPVAAFAACPVVALISDRMIRSVAAIGLRWCVYLPLILIETLLIFAAVWFRVSGQFAPGWAVGYSVAAILLACAVLVVLIQRLLRAVLELMNARRAESFRVPPMPDSVRTGLIGAGALAVLSVGLWVGLKFKHVYLDYWPADPNYTSFFMRMTASDAKPFYACRFIRENRLSGKMFNYWTEGGFIAYGQEPDPNTGRTPLRLFMDGRAQAAYNVEAFDLWSLISSGGPAVRRAVSTNRPLTSEDYIEVAQWISEQLRSHNVWMAMMPAKEFNSPFTNGLEHSLDWRTVFLNNKQKIFVDVNSPQGKTLYEGMFSGQTIYPNEFSRSLSLGHNHLLFQSTEQKQKGLELVIKALNLNPSPAPMLEILLIAARFRELLPRVDSLCAQYATDFEENKATYASQDGYNFRLESARLAVYRLERVAEAQGQTDLARQYGQLWKQYESERNGISASKRW